MAIGNEMMEMTTSSSINVKADRPMHQYDNVIPTLMLVVAWLCILGDRETSLQGLLRIMQSSQAKLNSVQLKTFESKTKSFASL